MSQLLQTILNWFNPDKTQYSFPYTTKRLEREQITIPDPRITLSVKTPNLGYLNIKFLVDSGADITLLPINPYGSLFNFTPQTDNNLEVIGLSHAIKAYPTQLTFKLGNTEHTIRAYFADAQTLPILGRLDIWDKFTIQFDNTNHQTKFTSLT